MAKRHSPSKYYLGIEGGGTKTTWVITDENFKIVDQGIAGPGNYIEMRGLKGYKPLIAQISRKMKYEPSIVGACHAGCHTEAYKKEINSHLSSVFKKAKFVAAGEDTMSGYYGSHGNKDGIMVIAGTGSNVTGKKGSRFENAGGWDAFLGDRGSGYNIAHHALRYAYASYDKNRKISPLAKALMRHAKVKDMDELCYEATFKNYEGKENTAAFAQCVLELAQKGDKDAQKVVRSSVDGLAENLEFICKRTGLKNPPVGLVGGLFKNSFYFKTFCSCVRKRVKVSKIFINKTHGGVGSILYALDKKK
jgi:N-acetylglucosamine kinase-like BadF-type ATPase